MVKYDEYDNTQYSEYYDGLTTFKINKEIKKKTWNILKKKRIKIQDFFDDAMREYLIQNEIKDIPRKVRKVIKIL